jgi:hypothetical protein
MPPRLNKLARLNYHIEIDVFINTTKIIACKALKWLKIIKIKNNNLKQNKMNENAFIKIGEIRKYIVKKYGLDTTIRTKNNIIYKNDDIVLIENVVTGDLKIKKNTR